MSNLATVRARYLAPHGPAYLSTEQVVADVRAMADRIDSLLDMIYTEAGEHEACFCWMCKELRAEIEGAP